MKIKGESTVKLLSEPKENVSKNIRLGNLQGFTEYSLEEKYVKHFEAPFEAEFCVIWQRKKWCAMGWAAARRIIESLGLEGISEMN